MNRKTMMNENNYPRKAVLRIGNNCRHGGNSRIHRWLVILISQKRSTMN